MITFPNHLEFEIDSYLPPTSNITTIIFNTTASYDLPLYNLPPTVTQLKLGNGFNQPLNYPLPPSLIRLELGFMFNQYLKNLPSKLTHLAVGSSFDKPVDCLPSSLTHLFLGDGFCHPVNDLPSSLTHLYLGKTFDKSVDHLPPHLVYLGLSDQFRQSCEKLPNTLQILKMQTSTKRSSKLPDTLRECIGLHGFFPQYPTYLSKVCFSRKFNSILTENALPNTITTIVFNATFNSEVHWLPPNLILLSFGPKFNQPLRFLPPTLEELKFGTDFNHPIELILPNGLKILKLGVNFDEIITIWPPLIKLRVYAHWCLAMDFRLKFPNSITHLWIYENFSWENPAFSLPPKLTHLCCTVPGFYTMPCAIPATLQELALLTEVSTFVLTNKSGSCSVHTRTGKIWEKGRVCKYLHQRMYM